VSGVCSARTNWPQCSKRKEEGGRRKEEGGRRKEEGERKKEKGKKGGNAQRSTCNF